MREILFRGKRTENGEWVYSSFIMQDKEHKLLSTEVELFDGEKWRAVVPETVGEYTGLTDKNGKKIFEGDIMRYGYPLPDDYDLTSDDYLIIFADGAFRGQFIDSPKYTPKIYDICFSSYYIVGNKWDNSELLEVEE